MKQLGSNFATILGLVLLGALALLAAYLRLSALLGAALALWLLCLVAHLWARFSLRHINVSLKCSECRAFPGEELDAELSLTNAKFLPLIWLEARFPLEKNSCVASVEEEPASEESPMLKESFLWVMPQQRLFWHQRAKAIHRGVVQVEEMELASGDGFGLVDRARRVRLSVPFRFVVYPALRPVDPGPILRRMSELERAERGLYTDPTLIKNIRDYEPGDSVRNINWRLLAHQSKLQVNIREPMAMRRVCLALDLESFSYTEVYEYGGEAHKRRCVHVEELERMLSLLASVIVAVHERGVLCSLLLPGEGEQAWRLLNPIDRGSQVTELLTALAVLNYKGGVCALPEGDLFLSLLHLGQIIVFAKELTEKHGMLTRALEDMNYAQVVQSAADELLAATPNLITETELTGL